MSAAQFRCKNQDHTDHPCARPENHAGACSYPRDAREWKKFYAHDGESTDGMERRSDLHSGDCATVRG